MLVIHIGPRKTASTYLQSNFYRNRKELLRKGWLYPVLSLRVRNAHHGIVQSLKEVRKGEGAVVRGMAKAGRLAASKGANILISSENFRKWKASEIALLGKCFGQQDVLVVYTLRDPLDLLVSGWGENVKMGRTASLEAYARKHLSAPHESPILDCLVPLEPILAEPGLRLKVLNFEDIKRRKADIYQEFGRHILGLDDLKPDYVKPRNQSFPVEINDFLRLLARRIDYNNKDSDLLLSRQFGRTHSQAEIDAIAATIKRVGGDAAKMVRFSRDDAWFREQEVRVIERLGPMLVPAPSDGRLFSEGVVESLSYDIDRLAAHPEIASLLDRAVLRLKKARRRFARNPVVAAWRYVQRLFSV